MDRRYYILDVFTDTALAGNPLAVVIDSEGLDDAAMQKIAAEFNLSETVFAFPPRDSANLARVRIFTPRAELPFAGHPTVGAAILAATLDVPDLLASQEVGLVLEEEIGPVHCTVRHRRGEAAHARFDVPKLAEPWGDPPDAAALAAEFGLDPADIGFAGHRPTRFTSGVPFTFVPVSSLDVLGRARLRPGDDDKRAAFYLYTLDPEAGAERSMRARNLVRGLGIYEDPATGSAAAAFAGALLANEPLGDGDHDCRIRQGVEMGRPSRIGLAFSVSGGRLASATIGGEAVIVGDGTLHL